MISRSDIFLVRKALDGTNDAKAIVAKLIEDHGQPALNEFVGQIIDRTIKAADSRQKYQPPGEGQMAFEFLKATYPDEADVLIPVEELSLEVGLANRAKLLQEADDWDVPRYSNRGAKKRQEAAELERLLRLRFGDVAVDSELRGRATMTLGDIE